MHAKSQWTPGGLALWLIAAVLATLVVCAQTERRRTPANPSPEVEVELEFESRK